MYVCKMHVLTSCSFPAYELYILSTLLLLHMYGDVWRLIDVSYMYIQTYNSIIVVKPSTGCCLFHSWELQECVCACSSSIISGCSQRNVPVFMAHSYVIMTHIHLYRVNEYTLHGTLIYTESMNTHFMAHSYVIMTHIHLYRVNEYTLLWEAAMHVK